MLVRQVGITVKRAIFALFLLLSVLILSPAISADTPSSYEVKYFIEYDRVLVDIQAEFDEPTFESVSYALPLDASGILAYVNGDEVEPRLAGNRVVIPLKNSDSFRLEFISKSLVAGDELVHEVQYPFNTSSSIVRVSLPSDARLPERINSASQRSVFPKPKAVYSDGLNIDLVWQFGLKQKGESVPLMVRFIRPDAWVWWAIFILVFFVVALGVLSYILHRRGKRVPEVITKEVTKEVFVDSGYENHLKEDEQQVVNILKLKEGSTDQGTLRVTTDFSKAKLSGLLKEMEQRKIIHKEKRGKKNYVFLRKQ